MISLNEAQKLHDEDKLIGSFKMSNNDYHSCAGVSSTFLINTTEYSLAHAKAWKEEDVATKEMKQGSLIHMAILEPELLHEIYKVVPTLDKRTAEGKAAWKESFETGIEPITQKTLDEVQEIRAALLRSKTAQALFSGGIAEQAYFARDPYTDVLIKAKADYINPKLKILIDVKTTSDGRLWNIKKSVFDYGYRTQSAFYLDVINQAQNEFKLDAVIWVFIEKTKPYGVRFVEAKQEWLDLGRELYKKGLYQYKHAMETGDFPCYDDQIITIDDKESL